MSSFLTLENRVCSTVIEIAQVFDHLSSHDRSSFLGYVMTPVVQYLYDN